MIKEISNSIDQIEIVLEELKTKLHKPVETKEDILVFSRLYNLKAMLIKLHNRIYEYNLSDSLVYPKKTFIHGYIMDISYICEGPDHIKFKGYDVERVYDDNYRDPQFSFKVKYDNIHLLATENIIGFAIRVSDLSTKEEHTFEFNDFHHMSKIKMKQYIFIGNIITITFDHCVKGITAYKINGFMMNHKFTDNHITKIDITPINQISLIQHKDGIEDEKIVESSKQLFYLRQKVIDLTTSKPPLF